MARRDDKSFIVVKRKRWTVNESIKKHRTKQEKDWALLDCQSTLARKHNKAVAVPASGPRESHRITCCALAFFTFSCFLLHILKRFTSIGIYDVQRKKKTGNRDANRHRQLTLCDWTLQAGMSVMCCEGLSLIGHVDFKIPELDTVQILN